MDSYYIDLFTSRQDFLRGLELGKDTMERVVEAGDVRGLKELLLRGTHIKGEGYCLLHRAAKKGDLAMIRLLLAVRIRLTDACIHRCIPSISLFIL